MTMHDQTPLQNDPLILHRHEMARLLARLEHELEEARHLVREFKTIRDRNREVNHGSRAREFDHEDT